MLVLHTDHKRLGANEEDSTLATDKTMCYRLYSFRYVRMLTVNLGTRPKDRVEIVHLKFKIVLFGKITVIPLTEMEFKIISINGITGF